MSLWTNSWFNCHHCQCCLLKLLFSSLTKNLNVQAVKFIVLLSPLPVLLVETNFFVTFNKNQNIRAVKFMVKFSSSFHCCQTCFFEKFEMNLQNIDQTWNARSILRATWINSSTLISEKFDFTIPRYIDSNIGQYQKPIPVLDWFLDGSKQNKFVLGYSSWPPLSLHSDSGQYEMLTHFQGERR